MSVGAQVLAANQNLVGSSALASVLGLGGRSAVTIDAQAYPGAGNLFLQVQNMSGNWIGVNSGGFTANQVFSFDSPPGQYRLACLGSSAIGVYASLSNLQY